MIPAGGRSHWRQVTLQHIPKRSTQQSKNMRESYLPRSESTLPQTEIAPENGWLGDYFHFREGSFLKKAHSKHSPDSNNGKR